MAKSRHVDLPAPTIADRFINWFDPVAGTKRAHARALQALSGAYVGASRSRRALKAWNPLAGDADADSLDDLPTLRERSRDARRNIPIAAGAISTNTQNVVGGGLTLQSTIDADRLGMSDDQAAEWEATTEQEFRFWADSPDSDAARTLPFGEQQELAFGSVLENGDAFALLASIERPRSPYRLAVQLIEADRISNPKHRRDTAEIAGGVERDPNGAPLAYHVLRQHPGAHARRASQEWDRIVAFGPKTGRRNVLHLYRKLRIGQTRGVPYLAPVIEPLKQLGRYTDAEIAAAVIAALFTVFVETPHGLGLDDMEGEAAIDGDSDRDDVQLAEGGIVDLAPGEKVSSQTPGRPNSGFDPFMTACLRQIGVALELPFEILIKHFTSSYSASRGALEEAWKTWRTRRKWLVRALCTPVYEAWLTEAVAIGRVSAPGFLDGDPAIRAAYCGCEWIGPPKGQLREDQEMTAAGKRLELNVSTLSRETAQITGGDWRRNLRQRRRERRLEAELDGGSREPSAPLVMPDTDVQAALRDRDAQQRLVA